MLAVPPLTVELGGLSVRRLLPRRQRRLVGAWCFLDVFGPLAVGGGKPLDVPPHPHIGLQTVTWLLEGEALHTDSLGSRVLGTPGTLNLMTAGRGIAHAEETPPGAHGALHGVQLWIALPDAHRHTAPAFDHHPQRPVLEAGPGVRVTVILGALQGLRAEARTFSPLLAAEVAFDHDSTTHLSLDAEDEHAVIPLRGELALDGVDAQVDTLYFLERGRRALALSGGAGTRALLLGGPPFPDNIVMWWNFVARTAEEIEAARDEWENGRRFGEVTGYPGARLAAPRFTARPVPANPAS